MTEPARHRLSLLLAIAGTLTVVLQLSADLWLDNAAALRLPAFEKSAPDVRDWPGHLYLPIG
jgi:hypothetical protein